MLSGEGNENGEKTTIGLIRKKQRCTCSTLFVHFFTVVLHDYNVKLPEPSWLLVLWRKCRTCSCSFFFSLPLIFTLVAATKFPCCSSNKKMSPLSFISRSSCLSLFFSLSFAGLSPTFSFSLSFSCSIFQICGHDN